MFIVRFLWSLFAIPLASLAGNWVGDQLRAEIMGEPVHQWRLVHETAEGEKVIGLNPRPTTFVLSLLVGFLTRPGWLTAFVSGVLISVLAGNQLERPFWALVDEWLVLNRR